MKFKRQSKTVYKKNKHEHYIFKNGVAKVPNIKYKGKPMIITLKEFNELTQGDSNAN